MLATLQGFLCSTRALQGLDALPNTTTDLFRIRTLDYMASPMPLSTIPRALPHKTVQKLVLILRAFRCLFKLPFAIGMVLLLVIMIPS